jgi:hypothetical protein
MPDCPCDREKRVDPLCCAAGMCAREDEKEEFEMERAEIGIDGNCGFALLGPNLQEGEAEFVEIALPLEASQSPTRYNNIEWRRHALRAATTAYRRLRERLADREFSYYLGPSHPNYIG